MTHQQTGGANGQEQQHRPVQHHQKAALEMHVERLRTQHNGHDQKV